MISETRPPEMISLSMSMPPSSQPSQCFADGGANTAQVRAVVEYGAMTGAASASTTKNTMMNRPSEAAFRSSTAWRISPPRLLETWPARPASVAMALTAYLPLACVNNQARSLADPRVELEIGQVGEQVQHHDGHGKHQEPALQHRVVALVDRLPERLADARPGEDVLDQDRAADDPADRERDQRRDRQQRVPHYVPGDDPPV